MNDRLKRFFEEQLQPEDVDEYSRAVGIQYATAALLIQVAKSDSEQDELERAMINVLLQDTFDLSDEMLEEILEFADEALSEADSIDQFVEMVKDHFDYPDKVKLVEYLWVVAFADGRLDRYEEQFIQKVSDYIQVSEDDFNQAKQAAQER